MMLFLWALFKAAFKYGPALEKMIEAIEAHETQAARDKFAADYTKGWEDATETGDPAFLHRVINDHPRFKMRK